MRSGPDGSKTGPVQSGPVQSGSVCGLRSERSADDSQKTTALSPSMLKEDTTGLWLPLSGRSYVKVLVRADFQRTVIVGKEDELEEKLEPTEAEKEDLEKTIESLKFDGRLEMKADSPAKGSSLFENCHKKGYKILHDILIHFEDADCG